MLRALSVCARCWNVTQCSRLAVPAVSLCHQINIHFSSTISVSVCVDAFFIGLNKPHLTALANSICSCAKKKNKKPNWRRPMSCCGTIAWESKLDVIKECSPISGELHFSNGKIKSYFQGKSVGIENKQWLFACAMGNGKISLYIH